MNALSLKNHHFRYGLLILVLILTILGVYNKIRAHSKKQAYSRVERKFTPKLNRFSVNSSRITKPLSPEIQKTLPVIAPSSLSVHDDEAVKKAIDEFRNQESGLDAAWRIYRQKVYHNMGVDGDDLAELDHLLSRHMDVILDIQKDMQSYTIGSDEAEALIKVHQQAFDDMDKDVETFLGPERFLYLVYSRQIFNKAYQASTHTFTEYLGW